jgi:hypothetical protein
MRPPPAPTSCWPWTSRTWIWPTGGPGSTAFGYGIGCVRTCKTYAASAHQGQSSTGAREVVARQPTGLERRGIDRPPRGQGHEGMPPARY